MLRSAAWSRRYGNQVQEVLNEGPGPPGAAPPDLGGELRRRSLAVKARLVDPETGRVNYAAAADLPELHELVQLARLLPAYPLSELRSRSERLAFWINLYNALTLHAVVAFRVRWTVWEAPGFFDRAAYRVAGRRFSLQTIEHGVLRANGPVPYTARRALAAHDPRAPFAFGPGEFDARIHFALNCASRSCPPIGFYEAAAVEEQLALAARAFLTAETEVVGRRITTSSILRWYRADFGPDLVRFLALHLPPNTLPHGQDVQVRFRPYDWRLNA